MRHTDRETGRPPSTVQVLPGLTPYRDGGSQGIGDVNDIIKTVRVLPDGLNLATNLPLGTYIVPSKPHTPAFTPAAGPLPVCQPR